MNVDIRGKRKKKKGIVISNKMEKTVVVQVERTMRHPRYEKIITQKSKFYAHNDHGPLQMGDVVEIIETRPLSKLKRWRVVAVVS